jgi:hypothetical protein
LMGVIGVLDPPQPDTSAATATAAAAMRAPRLQFMGGSR